MDHPAVITAGVLVGGGLIVAYLLHRWVESRRRPVSISMSFVGGFEAPKICPGCLSTQPTTSRTLHHKEVVYSESTKRQEYERSRSVGVPIYYCSKCKWLDVLFWNLARLFLYLGIFGLGFGSMGLGFAIAPAQPLREHSALARTVGTALIASGVASVCVALLLRGRAAIYMLGKGSDLRFSIRDKSYAKSFREAVQQANRR